MSDRQSRSKVRPPANADVQTTHNGEVQFWPDGEGLCFLRKGLSEVQKVPAIISSELSSLATNNPSGARAVAGYLDAALHASKLYRRDVGAHEFDLISVRAFEERNAAPARADALRLRTEATAEIGQGFIKLVESALEHDSGSVVGQAMWFICSRILGQKMTEHVSNLLNRTNPDPHGAERMKLVVEIGEPHLRRIERLLQVETSAANLLDRTDPQQVRAALIFLKAFPDGLIKS